MKKEDIKTLMFMLLKLVLMVGSFFFAPWVGMTLWNYIAAGIIGLPTLSYWQFWGLMILCSFLFDFNAFKKIWEDDRNENK